MRSDLQPPLSDLRGSASSVESEVIGLFVELSRLLGQPRSYAEIYGLLFISPGALTMDDIIERLQLSKGSASQGLRFLNQLGAVRAVYIPGDRRTHYEAVAELKSLTSRFLRDNVVPHLDSGLERLDRINELTKGLSSKERQHVAARIKLLQSWERNGRRVLPILARILGR